MCRFAALAQLARGAYVPLAPAPAQMCASHTQKTGRGSPPSLRLD